MASGHHGSSDEDRIRQEELMKIFRQQSEPVMKRAYPEGRLGADDDGQLAFLVAADPDKKVVRIEFNKPVTWMAMSAADAVKLAEMLTQKARQVADKPLTVTIG